MIDVANDFVFGSEYRKTVFGEFEDVDMRRDPNKNVAFTRLMLCLHDLCCYDDCLQIAANLINF